MGMVRRRQRDREEAQRAAQRTAVHLAILVGVTLIEVEGLPEGDALPLLVPEDSPCSAAEVAPAPELIGRVAKLCARYGRPEREIVALAAERGARVFQGMEMNLGR